MLISILISTIEFHNWVPNLVDFRLFLLTYNIPLILNPLDFLVVFFPPKQQSQIEGSSILFL